MRFEGTICWLSYGEFLKLLHQPFFLQTFEPTFDPGKLKQGILGTMMNGAIEVREPVLTTKVEMTNGL